MSRLLGAMTAVACLGTNACGRISFDASPGHDDTAADAGSGDAEPGASAPGDSVTSLDCSQRPGMVFCDGFEDTTLAMWTSQQGAIGAVSNLVHSGTRALRADSPGTVQNADVVTHTFPNLTSGSIHYRGWFYLPSGYVTQKINLISTDGQAGEGVVALIDTNELRAWSAPAPFTVTSGIAPPRDRWFCVEVHIDISSTNGAVRLDLDGTEIGSNSGFNTLASGGYTTFGAGAMYVGPTQSSLTLYVDDVATGTLPIGCS